jgi:hypothetical protein
MKNRLRFLVLLLAPVLLADGILFVLVCFKDLSWPSLRTWNGVEGMVAFSYFFAAFPSLLYALLMEKAYGRGLDPNSWAAVRKSSWLGTLAGVLIGLFMAITMGGFSLAGTGFAFAIAGTLFTGIGLAVGFILGLLIKAFSCLTERKLGSRFLRWDRPFAD